MTEEESWSQKVERVEQERRAKEEKARHYPPTFRVGISLTFEQIGKGLQWVAKQFKKLKPKKKGKLP